MHIDHNSILRRAIQKANMQSKPTGTHALSTATRGGHYVACFNIGERNKGGSEWLAPVLYSSVAPLKKRGNAASSIMTKSSSSSVTPTSRYSFTRLYLACSRAHWLPTFLHRDRAKCVISYAHNLPLTMLSSVGCKALRRTIGMERR